MPTLEQIYAQINALPHKYIFYTKKEINYLPEILTDDEQVLALTSGYMQYTTWLITCTNRRVILLDRGMIFGLRIVQMNLDRIQSIDASYAILFGSLRFWDGASSINISLIWKSSIAPFIKTVRDAMDNYKKLVFHEITDGVHATGNRATTDIASQIERLADLREKGILTLDEFEKQKKKLLG